MAESNHPTLISNSLGWIVWSQKNSTVPPIVEIRIRFMFPQPKAAYWIMSDIFQNRLNPLLDDFEANNRCAQIELDSQSLCLKCKDQSSTIETLVQSSLDCMFRHWPSTLKSWAPQKNWLLEEYLRLLQDKSQVAWDVTKSILRGADHFRIDQCLVDIYTLTASDFMQFVRQMETSFAKQLLIVGMTLCYW